VSDPATLHRDATVVAAHTDFSPDLAQRRASGETGVFSARYAPILRRGGISAICEHIAGDAPYLVEYPFRNTRAADRLKFALQGAAMMHKEAEESADSMLLATSVEQVHQAKREGRIAVIQCLEGAAGLEDDVGLLTAFHRLGVRIVGLTHDERNLFADGVRVGGRGGLTALGRDLVAEMNRLGVLVDVSHINQRGFWDVLEVSRDPIHASHSNATALCDHPRNLDDEMLRAIAAAGGLVGVHALAALIATEPGVPSLDRLLDHVDHMVEVMGEDHVAIGPDMMEAWPADDYRGLWRTPRLSGLQFAYPPEFDSYAKWPNVTAGLARRGYSDQAIRKILGLNVLRLLERVWR
jgi:membrane dipeptidase